MTTDLAQSLKSHDEFFKMYIDMIPKEIYRAGDEDDEDMNPRYFKHRKQPLTLDEKKSLSKKRKSEKYGLATEDDANEVNDNDAEMDEDNPDLSKKMPANLANLSLTKNKKQKVVQTTTNSNVTNKNNNGNGNGNGNGSKAISKQTEVKVDKKGNSNNNISSKPTNKTNNVEDLHQSLLLSNSSIDSDNYENDYDDDMSTSVSGSLTSISSELLEFNELRGKAASKVTSTLSQNGTMESNNNNNNHSNLIHSNKDNKDTKPGSKVRRLKRMLQEAEDKRNKLEALRKQGEGGQEQAKQQVWNDALIDASGNKSVKDTKKLKKALKRIDKTKEKSAKEWQARLEAVDESKAARQEKRENNLQARKEGRPTTSAAASTSGTSTVSDKDKNKGSVKDGEGGHSGSRGGSGGHKKSFSSASGSGSNGKQAIRNPLNKTHTSSHTSGGSPHGKNHSSGGGGSSSASGNHHKANNRPGFEGKKKSNSQFLNHKK